MTPRDELLAVFDRWHRRVEGLKVWSGGEARLHDLLVMAVWPRAEGARRGVEVVLENAIRADAFQVKKTGRAFRVTYRWDVSLEVADMYLERQAHPEALPGPGPEERQWAAGKPRETLNAFRPPPDILRLAMHRTTAAVQAWRAAQQEPVLPDDFALGDGLTVGVMAQVLACLMALAQLGELAHAQVRHPGTTLVHFPREILAGLLSDGCEGLSPAMAETAAERLMAGPKRSVRSSVLLPNGPLVTMLPVTLFPRAVDSVLLRTAATEPGRYGPIGEKQGNRAAAWARWLEQIPGIKIAEGVKIKGSGGRRLGDLDLIAVDPHARRGIILELKWPIDALTLPDTRKIDQIILGGSRQLARNRRILRGGDGAVKLPSGWPALSDVEWTWGVGTPKQLYTGPLPEPETYATSLRYLKNLGPPATIEAVATALREPDVPRLGHDYVVKRATLQLGRDVVHFDAIHVRDTTWRPIWANSCAQPSGEAR